MGENDVAIGSDEVAAPDRLPASLDKAATEVEVGVGDVPPPRREQVAVAENGESTMLNGDLFALELLAMAAVVDEEAVVHDEDVDDDENEEEFEEDDEEDGDEPHTKADDNLDAAVVVLLVGKLLGVGVPRK